MFKKVCHPRLEIKGYLNLTLQVNNERVVETVCHLPEQTVGSTEGSEFFYQSFRRSSQIGDR